MKIALISVLLILLLACTPADEKPTQATSSKIVASSLQSIIKDAGVVGAILIYDLSEDTYYSNDFDRSATGQLPASTFKIPNTIVGLETGAIESETTIFKWDGAPKRFKSWEQDLVLRDAFHYSCVPCYQSVARQVGTKQMNAHLSKLSFGDMDVTKSNLDMFWLIGKSKITPFEQIQFLVKFYKRTLPISDRTHSIVKDMLVIEQGDKHILSGKTGWSVNGDINNGWFVGYLEKNGSAYFFATNIEPSANFDMRDFSAARKQITSDGLMSLNIIETKQ